MDPRLPFFEPDDSPLDEQCERAVKLVDNENWQEYKKSDIATTYSRPGMVGAVKSVGILPHSLEKIGICSMQDEGSGGDKQLLRIEYISGSSFSKQAIVHAFYKGVGIVSGRDFVVDRRVRRLPDGRWLSTTRSVERQDVPLAKGFVRGRVFISGLSIISFVLRFLRLHFSAFLLRPLSNSTPDNPCTELTLAMEGSMEGNIPGFVIGITRSFHQRTIGTIKLFLDGLKTWDPHDSTGVPLWNLLNRPGPQ